MFDVECESLCRGVGLAPLDSVVSGQGLLDYYIVS